MRDSYKFIDLFCGIGGFRLGFEKNNFKCVFSSDNNKNCQKVYKNNFGEDVFGDIKKIDISKIPRFDVLTAGFPCQPFSISVCSNIGLDYVSCSPYRVPVARLAAAQAEIRKKLN